MREESVYSTVNLETLPSLYLVLTISSHENILVRRYFRRFIKIPLYLLLYDWLAFLSACGAAL